MAKSRKVSSISKEFDGKEVQGKLIERSGLFGSKVSKEVFKMPVGGKHIEKTRTNKKGDVVSRLSRDTKVNPLKVFNDNKQQAYKKAGGEMSTYKKALTKAQAGYMVRGIAPEFKKAESTIGPLTETQARVAEIKKSMNDPMSDGRGPRTTTPKQDMSNPVQKKGGSVKRKRK
jgi:hypothetical protein